MGVVDGCDGRKTTIVESANLDQSSDDRNDGNTDDGWTVHPSPSTYRTDSVRESDGRLMCLMTSRC